jgi:hypothetical protein
VETAEVEAKAPHELEPVERASAPYPDLARYLAEAAELEPATPREARERARAARRDLDRARRGLDLLGVLAQVGLAAACLGLALALVPPTMLPGRALLARLGIGLSPAGLLAYVDGLLALALGAMLTRLVLGIADLEVRRVQVTVISAATLLLAAAAREVAGTVLLVGLALGSCLQVFTSWKRRYKLATLAWLEAEPDATDAVLREVRAARGPMAHARLGIPRFGEPGYRRAFRVRRSKKRTRTELVAAPAGVRPPRGVAWVEVARRDPRVDLSSLDEFFVCCFLGGAQDTSAFDFLLAPSVAYLDLVSPKGRTLRALVLACVAEAGELAGRPVLVVDAVFGRDGGGVGSARDDDRFLRREIEAYARSIGFAAVLYATTPTNSRPRAFLRTLLADDVGEPTRLRCHLTVEDRPLKLELFGRREGGGSVYGTLIGETLGGAGAYATRGRVTGRLVRLQEEAVSERGWELLEPWEESAEEEVLHQMTSLVRSPLGARLVERALARRYDPSRVFKMRELAAVAAGAPPEVPSEELARAFLEEREASYAGFREKFLAGLEGARREFVRGWMARRIGADLDALRWIDRVLAAPAAGACLRLEGELRAWRKLVSRYRLEPTPAQLARATGLEERVGSAARRVQEAEARRRRWLGPIQDRIERWNRGRYS